MGDPALTDLGRRQAQATGLFLKDHEIELLLASPLRRTQETAEYIGEKVGLPFQTSELLKERINWGEDPSQSFDEFLNTWQRATVERQWQPPVGDSSQAAGQRLENAIDTVDSKYHRVVFVTHGDIIGDLLRNIFGEAQLRSHYEEFHHVRALGVPECSITIVAFEGEKPVLQQLAGCEHLAGLE